MGLVVRFPSPTHEGQANQWRATAVSAPGRLTSVIAPVERLLDWLAVICGVLLPVAIVRLTHNYPPANSPILAVTEAAALFGLMVVLLLEKHGEYRPCLSLLAVRETEGLLRVGAECCVVALPLVCIAAPSLPRLLVMTCFLSVPVVMVIEKAAFHLALCWLRSAGYGRRRAVILGGGPLAKSVYSALLRSPKLGLDPAAIVDKSSALNGTQIRPSSYRTSPPARVLAGPLTAALFRNLGASILVIADPELDNLDLLDFVGRATDMGVTTYIVSRDYMKPGYWLDYSELDGMMLASLMTDQQQRLSEAAKRVMDVALASLLLILLAVPCALAAALIRLTSPGPAIFKQLRVGRRGQLFSLYKFRSMHAAVSAYAFSPKNALDSRITPIGRWLRRSCFDEVPQLWNVLKGEMSLVGPRPEMPFIVDKYTAFQRQRLAVTPGITGLWQLSGDRNCLIHENLEYDLYYIRHRNLFMDFAVLLHTFVFAARGI